MLNYPFKGIGINVKPGKTYFYMNIRTYRENPSGAPYDSLMLEILHLLL